MDQMVPSECIICRSILWIVAISGVFKSPLWYVINMLIGAGIIVHQYESHHICLDVS